MLHTTSLLLKSINLLLQGSLLLLNFTLNDVN